MFKHIVCFRFEDRAQAPIVAQKLRALEESIPQIRSIELGVDELNTQRSYDLILITLFEHEQDYKLYDEHPAHQEVRKYIHAVRKESIAIDYQC